MAQTAGAKVAEARSGNIAKKKAFKKLVDIRVSPNSYFVTFFLASFMSGFLVYLGRDLYAFLLFGLSWLIIPFLTWKDRIEFNGKFISRTGFLPKFWSKLIGKPYRLRVNHIEQIETQSIRALRRGGNVFYCYRTTVTGKGARFIFASGGEDYRLMINRLFNLVPNDVLDNRSLELRDYLQDPKETLMKAEFARIPSMEVLENSVNEFQNEDRALRSKPINKDSGDEGMEKADDLRQIANELRMSGYLLQSLEAFRRALLLNPKDAWLNFEFARCLHSFASLERNPKLIRRATAALRLAESKAKGDAKLLARIGESYFQYGYWNRSGKTFYSVLSIAENSFRSVRGLAEIALREGKIAHVIHHFASASHFAENTALKKWADGENEYFLRLCNDDDYMEAEMTRINWLESIERNKKMFLKFSLMGLLIVFFGILFNDTVADVGWVASFITIILWIGLVLSQSFLSERCPIIELED